MRRKKKALTELEKIADDFFIWIQVDKSALHVMQFCKLKNIPYKKLLQLKGMKGTFNGAYEEVISRIGNRRENGSIHFKYEASIAMKTLWMYEDEWLESDEWWANLKGIKPQPPKAVEYFIVPPSTTTVEADLRFEDMKKIDLLLANLLNTCKQETIYSVVDAIKEMGFNYDTIRMLASSKKEWREILDECHRYCFAWAEIAGLRRWIGPRKALELMCENDDNFKRHLEWRKTWDSKKEKTWKQRVNLLKVVTNQQYLSITQP